ncbi:amino acid ABC transporter permease [bacterium]|nr:MAG: amino acid ABC transporter permease [bacterium]
MNALTNYSVLLFNGSCVTLGAWLFAGTISMILGTCLGIISCQQIGSRGIIATIRIYTFVTKGIPVYVQILLAYFVLPQLIGINLPAFFAATGALAICSSGYVTEIVRAQINAIPRGQWDACFVLGYSLPQTIKRIIAPQALKHALPPLIGELEQLLKSTSLLATIGVTELTRVGMNIISRELNPLPVYLTIAVIYLLFSGMLNCLAWLINRKACS